MTTPLLGTSEIAEGVANQVPTHNLALRQMEARTIRALSMITMAPPAAVEGDSYIIPAGATGAWAGKTAQIASFIGGTWSYCVPPTDLRLWVRDIGAEYRFNGSAWVSAGSGVSLSAVNVFSKNQSVAPSALASGAAIVVDASLSNNFKLTLGANATLANPSNLTEGMVLNFAIDQDATGSRTLAYGSLYKFPGGIVPVLSTAAGAKDFMSCYYDGAILRCQMNKAFA